MSDPDDDTILAADFAGGSAAALAGAYRRYAATIHGVSATVLATDEDAAAELTAATFVRAWRERGQYRPHQLPLAGWLERALAHELLQRDPQRAGLAETIDAMDGTRHALVRGACLDRTPVDELAGTLGEPAEQAATQLHEALIVLRDRWESDHEAL